ncbi:related to 54S ribosomal protein L37, mitochondrial [Zygosaccharomyces bailii]|nr:related to 54S ribosomal protein L37, mitochondrial [Zygosaccharomyces bailii]
MFQLLRYVPRRFLFSSPATFQVVKSSCPAGTVINVNTRKSGKEPIALEDKEYPDWLWEVLDPEAQARKLQADPLKARKKQLRKTNRDKVKQNNFLKQI